MSPHGGNEMRSLQGQGAALHDSPYGTAFYGAASGKSYFG